MPEPPGTQTVEELQKMCLEAQVDKTPRAEAQQQPPAPEEDEYLDDADDDFE